VHIHHVLTLLFLVQGDFGDDDIVDITNMDESDIVSIDFDGGDFQEAADIGDVNYLP
jgi:hypothetical protein